MTNFKNIAGECSNEMHDAKQINGTLIAFFSKTSVSSRLVVSKKPVVISVELSNVELWYFVRRPWVLKQYFHASGRSRIMHCAVKGKSRWHYGKFHLVPTQFMFFWKIMFPLCHTFTWSATLLRSRTWRVGSLVEVTKHHSFPDALERSPFFCH